MSGGAEPDLELLLTPAQLAELAAETAAAIGRDHPAGVTLVGVLKGSVPFLADLSRHLRVPTRIEFVALAPYDGATGRTRVVTDLGAPIAGESAVIVSGIVDTGFTTDFLLRHLRAGEPASLRVCTLADKRARRILPVPVDYAAFEAPDRFLLGYGLDYAGRYRNLRGLWAADGAALADDPDRHVAALYGRPGGA